MLPVFLNLGKTDDYTWKHDVLMKLHNISIREVLPTVMQNFPVNRKSTFWLRNRFSNLEDQLEGVPHGNILSVSLFAIAIMTS